MNKQLQSYIGMIYDSVTKEDGLDAIVESLVQDLDFRSGHITLEAMNQSGIMKMYSSGVSDEENRLYLGHFYKHDIWTHELSKKPPGQFYLSEQFVAPKELNNTEFYNDLCKKIDLGYATGCYLLSDGSYGIRIAFQHTHDQGSIGDKINFLNSLRPHLERAVTLKERLTDHDNQASTISSILDKFSVAGLIADEKGTIHYYNAQADSLLRRQDKIKLTGRRLAIQNIQQELNKSIFQAVLSAQGHDCLSNANTLVLKSSSGVTTHEILVEPFRGFDQRFGFQYTKSLALILINELVTERPLNEKILKDLFGLTEKELQLAQELARGRTLAEISKQSHRSMNTLKSHLKSLFKKTNTGSQTKLVSRLLTSIAAVRAGE